jgi:hypothetical protein
MQGKKKDRRNPSLMGGTHRRERRGRRESALVASGPWSRHGRDEGSWARCPCHLRAFGVPVGRSLRGASVPLCLHGYNPLGHHTPTTKTPRH